MAYSNELLGKRLKHLRVSNNLTQEELSKKLNIATNTLSNYENGNRQPTIEMLKNIINIFNVPSDFLISDNVNLIQNVQVAASMKNDNADLSSLSNHDKKLVLDMIKRLKENK